jgi:hypothetical protein
LRKACEGYRLGGMSQGRRPITVEIYNKLLASYRQEPGNHHSAGTHAGVFWRTAKKGWEEGWPNYPWASRPIREAIAEEQALARQRLAEQEKVRDEIAKREMETALRRAAELSIQPQADRNRVREDSIEARKVEGQIVRIARDNVLQMLGMTGEAITAFRPLLSRLQAALLAPDLEVTPGGVVKLMRELAATMKAAAESADMVAKMERLILGEPTEIMGVLSIDMTAEEALSEILATSEAAQRVLSGRAIEVAPNEQDSPVSTDNLSNAVDEELTSDAFFAEADERGFDEQLADPTESED